MENINENKDLKSKLQKEVIDEMLGTLNDKDPTFYYMNTSEVADLIFNQIQTPGSVTRSKLDLVEDLSRRDIQVLLSFSRAV